MIVDRTDKNHVDPFRPYAYFIEAERTHDGIVEDVATLFLTNRECPFQCIFCDLWKNTTDERVPVGAIPQQIDFALERLSSAPHIKLYNSGNFFDRQAIPPEDYGAIAARLKNFETVIVENHPKLCDDEVLRFRDLVDTQLEVAIGLETADDAILSRLNKGMTLDDFGRAARFCTDNGVRVRAFVLLQPPFGVIGHDAVRSALDSIRFAFDTGVSCCCVIPTRAGANAFAQPDLSGHFQPPSFAALEEVALAGIEMRRGRVFVDVWDAERFCDCDRCAGPRVERLRQMNLTQKITSPVVCSCGMSV